MLHKISLVAKSGKPWLLAQIFYPLNNILLNDFQQHLFLI